MRFPRVENSEETLCRKWLFGDKTANGFCKGTAFSSLKIPFRVMMSSATYATFRSLALIFQKYITMHEGRYQIQRVSILSLCAGSSILSSLWVQRVYFFRFWKFSILCTIDAIDLKLASKNSHCFAVDPVSDYGALQYFLQRRHWILGPGFISISPARMIRINKFVPFEGLKLCSPSELLRFPGFLILTQHWDTLLWEFM